MSEEKQAVIVITETPANGVLRTERRYDANVADTGEYTGTLRLLREGKCVAEYQPHAWLSWREEGAIASDGPADKRKLAIALEALKRIAGIGTLEDAHEAADEALAGIADVDL